MLHDDPCHPGLRRQRGEQFRKCLETARRGPNSHHGKCYPFLLHQKILGTKNDLLQVAECRPETLIGGETQKKPRPALEPEYRIRASKVQFYNELIMLTRIDNWRIESQNTPNIACLISHRLKVHSTG